MELVKVTNPQVTLVQPSTPSIDAVASTEPTECDSINGTITMTASGSNALQYSVDAGFSWQPAGNFTGLGAGNYLVAIRNIRRFLSSKWSNNYIDNTCCSDYYTSYTGGP